MATASLALLKGGGKKKVEEELTQAPVEAEEEEAPAEEIATEEEPVVDVDKMSNAELDKLVKDNEIEVPDNWKQMKLAEKRAWFKAQYPDADEPAPEAAAAPEPEPAPTPAPKSNVKTKTKAKTTGTAVTKPALTGEVMKPGDDPINDLVHEVENLAEAEAKQLVGDLANQTEYAYLKMGGVLSVIQANKGECS